MSKIRYFYHDIFVEIEIAFWHNTIRENALEFIISPEDADFLSEDRSGTFP